MDENTYYTKIKDFIEAWRLMLFELADICQEDLLSDQNDENFNRYTSALHGLALLDVVTTLICEIRDSEELAIKNDRR